MFPVEGHYQGQGMGLPGLRGGGSDPGPGGECGLNWGNVSTCRKVMSQLGEELSTCHELITHVIDFEQV